MKSSSLIAISESSQARPTFIKHNRYKGSKSSLITERKLKLCLASLIVESSSRTDKSSMDSQGRALIKLG